MKECPSEDNLLDWSMDDLKYYVTLKTTGMSIRKKIQFWEKLRKRIKEEKKKQGIPV